MIKINEMYLPKGHINRPGYYMKPEGIIYHSTANYAESAGDELHVKYLLYTAKNKSWHVTVDFDSATQHIPFNENAWAAGDGKDGYYNRNWIHVEIACNKTNFGKPLDRRTYMNAVDILAQIIMEYGWHKDKDRLQPHEVVYGKDCPHKTLFDRSKFEEDVFNLVNLRLMESKPSIQREGKVILDDGSSYKGYLINNQMYVPVRFVTDGLGGVIDDWDNKNKIAYISKRKGGEN